ncbi:Na(+)/H(+) antiporter subunit C [Leucobacter denitrificans]|uniref:Na(+)/H(+) antiporter subunit C n=1 Tax=Leucobacter denitrificans TaxID=683042 RepID=A0A7G9S668_9MICO|nr:Na(+)/H(+) antiporter subunit C [Leucobacter denitrificans]QNN63343.1 Na(+)/H(+) antiporter subunit C [Leucobacter denitrificans]
MTMPLVLVAVMVVMYTAGVYLMLDRSLTRILLGFLLVGNATNLLIFLMSGEFGSSPIVGGDDDGSMSDPLPQAFILTAIVITFGVSAFLLALIYRSWRLSRILEDRVEDDRDDLEISRAETLTTEEVTEEDLEDATEFEDDIPGDDSEDSDDLDSSDGSGDVSDSGKSKTGPGEGGQS